MIASDPVCSIGVDVMNVAERPGRATDAASFFATFESHFTTAEWAQIRAPNWNEAKQYKQFYAYWSMKEAYIKAIGIGLGFEDLRRAEFQWDVESNAIDFRLDGRLESNWKFVLNELEKDHIVTVARRP